VENVDNLGGYPYQWEDTFFAKLCDLNFPSNSTSNGGRGQARDRKWKFFTSYV